MKIFENTFFKFFLALIIIFIFLFTACNVQETISIPETVLFSTPSPIDLVISSPIVVDLSELLQNEEPVPPLVDSPAEKEDVIPKTPVENDQEKDPVKKILTPEIVAPESTPVLKKKSGKKNHTNSETEETSVEMAASPVPKSSNSQVITPVPNPSSPDEEPISENPPVSPDPVNITPNPTPTSSLTLVSGRYTHEDLELASRVAYLESGSFEGRKAVLNVIFNRCRSSDFGGGTTSVRDEVFRKNQFSVVKSDSFDSVSVPESLLSAANDIFNKENTVLPDNILFFRSSRKGEEWDSKVFYKTIGGNSFFSRES